MTDVEWILKKSMTDMKIATWNELADRIGFTRQKLHYRKKHPTTFTAGEINKLCNLFQWSDLTLGEFIRGIS